MIVENQKIKVKWLRRTRKHFESQGYVYTKNEDEFYVNVSDLSIGSHTKVEFICDYCLGKNQMDKFKSYKALLKQRETTNKDCCGHMECKNKKVHETYIKNLINNKETLAHKFPHLITEWSSKNLQSPYQFSYGSESRVWWICSKGHEWEDNVLHRTGSDRGCPYCSNKRVCMDNCLQTLRPNIASEWHPKKNDKLTPFDYTYGSDKIVWWLCKNGHEFKNSISNRTSKGTGCPICKESKGERKIREFLESLKIKFISQYEINGLVGLGGKNLKFDFSIFDNNKNLLFLIEFDGEFHFNKYYEEQNFETLQIHDKRKDQYCIDNSINLVRIPYWEFEDIEDILTKELTKYNLI
jgi:hypothetical protein